MLLETALVSKAKTSKTATSEPSRLTCEYLDNPSGLDVERPRFSWILKAKNDKEYGQMQTSYRIIVSNSLEDLNKNIGNVWDSKWVSSSNSQLISFEGNPLVSDRSYYWKVKIKDENGVESGWSKSAFWKTGIFKQEEWQANWIGNSEVYDIKAKTNNLFDPWFRKTFKLRKKPSKAMLMVASVGYHEVYVNGKKIDDHILAPAVSDHTKRARYIAYDIADKLTKGDNVIAIWLGTSWAIFPPYYLNEDRPLTPIVKAQVSIYDQLNPSKEAEAMMTISTDSSWKTKPSPNKLIGKWDFRKMGGEIWDARKEDETWNQVKCNDKDWSNSKVYPTKLTLSSQNVEPNRLFRQIKPIKIEDKGNGTYQIDMGVNFAGWTKIHLTGKEGDTIRILFSEREQEEMTFAIQSAYVIGKSGKGVFQNRFNYSSGRWITLKGCERAPQLNEVLGWMVRTDYKNATNFSCSDSLQNWIYNTTKWTFENLSIGGYIVDCPQRERLGYGGDAHATSETGMFNYHMGAFYTKWMEDWRDVQGTEFMGGNMFNANHARKKPSSGRILNNGIIPHTAPTFWGGGGPAWGGICITLPWFMYQHYGDKQVLIQNFEMMKGWLSFLQTNVNDNLLRKYGGSWDFLGDWLWPNATKEGMNSNSEQNLCLNNSYYVFNLKTAAKIAKIIGRVEEAELWEKQAINVANEVHKKFYNANDASYSDATMANLAAALLAEIPPKDLRNDLMKRLEKEIVDVRKGYIHAGITGGALLFKLLREEGRDDLIYLMASKTNYPSWGFMKNNGATTMWEMWEKDLPGHSLLHSSYLYPGAWYIDGIGGIKRDVQEIGFKKFIISPPAANATDLKFANTSFESPIGKIETEWKRVTGKLELRIVVPPNSLATLQLEERDKIDFSKYSSIRELPKNGNHLQYELKPGTYSF